MHAQLQNHDHKLLDLRTATAQLAQLKSLPTSSPLLLLGYFALLDSLLTHVPNPTDTIDSITRQIKKKLSLINNRWPREVDYAPFGSAKIDQIWVEMYACRSAVAHGGALDFKVKLKRLARISHRAAAKRKNTAPESFFEDSWSAVRFTGGKNGQAACWNESNPEEKAFLFIFRVSPCASS